MQAHELDITPPNTTYLVTRHSNRETYEVWAFDPSQPSLLTQVPTDPSATFPNDGQLVAVGPYLLAMSPMRPVPSAGYNFFFNLLRFDPTNPDPLNNGSVHDGMWGYQKFWDYYDYRDCPGGPEQLGLQLIPMTGGYVLSFLPTSGRGTFSLWNFDAAVGAPTYTDPLPARTADQDAFPNIGAGHQLLPIGNYVLDWQPSTSAYAVYSFDPQRPNPLPSPPVSSGTQPSIDATHQLVVVDRYVLDWVPSTGSYRLWLFDPHQANPFVQVLSQGQLPAGFDTTTLISAVQTTTPIDPTRANTPGTMDFMRTRVTKVVYYVLESRSFDNVVGWLYENGDGGVNWVDAAPPFQGASASNTNQACGQSYPQYKFEGGAVSTAFDLNSPDIDPFHGTADSIHQQWSGGYPAYQAGDAADMGGFVSNNGSAEAMVTFSPQQLAVLNGLAGAFAVSDRWFCSLPGGTTANRAYLASGSAYDITVSYESGSDYTFFPERQRRQSMWKVLANNGITDWAIYNSVEWGNPPAPYTYHLFVKNQVPSVDAAKATFAQPIDNFYQAAAAGTLPAFSFLEPVWFDPSGVFTSYHPTGDVLPGEQQLNQIYEALRNGPDWESTVLVISFSKGGGIYDHVPSPRAARAWPHDEVDGFAFDALGARVPAIVVSPLIPQATVFRSSTGVPFDHTSLTATVLSWFGIPRARWGLGDRVDQAPTFERVLQLATPRADKPSFTPAYDKTYPPLADGEDGCGG